MTDTRRDFLLGLAALLAAAGTAGGAGAEEAEDGALYFQSRIGDTVFFERDSAVLNKTAKATLDRQIDWLKRYTRYSIIIEGHCDNTGTREYNMSLGERYARAVKTYMVAAGISAQRIKTISYGKERPLVNEDNDAARARNRRAVTVLM